MRRSVACSSHMLIMHELEKMHLISFEILCIQMITAPLGALGSEDQVLGGCGSSNHDDRNSFYAPRRG